jgi:hypothetical protein
MRSTIWLFAALSTACTANIFSPTSSSPGPTERVRSELTAWSTGARRLSRLEYDNALRDLVGDTTRPAWNTLPEDTYTPFDNDYTTQNPSGALVDGADAIADKAVAAALADPTRRSLIVPCTATGPNDTDCFRAFLVSFGLKALRRPLASDEVDRFAALQSYSVEANDFDFGVALAAGALLEHPAFLYRLELAGTGPLSAYEIASRLSFLLWGSIPDQALLDLAGAGQLDTPDGRRAAAQSMLSDPRALDRWSQFHSFWLGYFTLPHSQQLNDAMHAESKALVDDVVFSRRADYHELFTSPRTFIDNVLADQYGLAEPGSAQWVAYPGAQRLGILSHGSVLSAFAKFTDTSPTQRGIFIRTRLLCGVVPPPPSNVATDAPPSAGTGSPCKVDRYAEHRANPVCASCHNQLDPIGFGLERYDKAGAYRTTDDGLPQCPISGDGQTPELGTFNGPGELGTKLTAWSGLDACITRQIYRFAVGRDVAASDDGNLGELSARFGDDGRRFTDLLLELVSSDAFAHAPSQGG